MATATTWAQSNVTSLELEFERLRLILRRKDGGDEGQLRSAVEMLRARRAEVGASSLDLLSDLFRLSEFERDLVLLCLAVEDDASFPVLLSRRRSNCSARVRHSGLPRNRV